MQIPSTYVRPMQPKLTYLDYLALELSTDQRYEFLEGTVRPIGGGTPRHSRIKVQLVGALEPRLDRSTCRSFASDLRVRVPATGLATYFDLMTVCGGLELHPEDANAVTNPTALFEVLSPSTEAWDRGGKFQHAQQILSLRHYVLVSQDEPLVEVYTRSEGGWLYTTHRAGEQIALTGLGATLAVDDLYLDLPPVPDAVTAG